jgi:hypothetical protein
MNDRIIFFSGSLGLAIALVFPATSRAQTITYSSIDAPLGVNGTSAYGISGNKIVGSYSDTNYVAHGFIYDGTNFTTLDPVNTELTYARGTDGRRVVGYFVNVTGTHGFVWDGTNYTTLNDPLASGTSPTTSAYGIDGTNIVGYYTTGTGLTHGFLYNGIGYTTIDYPGGTYGSYAQGISGTNIVGLGYDLAPGNGHSFIYNGKNFVTISNVIGNTAEAIDALAISSNDIAGYYYNGTTDSGFVWDQTNYTIVNYPSAKLTTVYGIDGNNIVGIYFDAQSKAHGFKATVIPPARLAIVSSANKNIISWPASLAGWTLQTNVGLASGSWGNYAGPVVNNTVTNVPPATGNVFFRLYHP